jgi:hypothetical protein
VLGRRMKRGVGTICGDVANCYKANLQHGIFICLLVIRNSLRSIWIASYVVRQIVKVARH